MTQNDLIINVPMLALSVHKQMDVTRFDVEIEYNLQPFYRYMAMQFLPWLHV